MADYYAEAQAAARLGDRDSAYAALEKRAEKMADPNYKGTGGGTSMAQAYKTIDSILAEYDSAEKAKANAAKAEADYQAQLAAARKSASQTNAANAELIQGLMNGPSAQEIAAANPVAQPITAPPTQYDRYDPQEQRDQLAQLRGVQIQQYNEQVDYATNRTIEELERNKQDAAAVYDQQRKQTEVQSEKALTNSALYAAARGDRGGIGQAQYNAIRAQTMQNHLAINQAQTKLATDTARQITDLRAQGEFQKADKLLEVTQSYLAQLMELEQWALSFNLNIDQLNESIRQWQYNYNLNVQELNLSAAQWEKSYQAQLAGLGIDNNNAFADRQFNFAGMSQDQSQWEHTFAANLDADKRTQLASSGTTLLEAGIIPSDSQLRALGMTKEQAQTYVAAVQAAAAAKVKTGSSSSTTKAPNAKNDPLGFLAYHKPSSKEVAEALLISAGVDENAAATLAESYMAGLVSNGETIRSSDALKRAMAAGSSRYEQVSALVDMRKSGLITDEQYENLLFSISNPLNR